MDWQSEECVCVCVLRQHSLLHDEGEWVEDALTDLRLQRRKKVRDDLRRQGNQGGHKGGNKEAMVKKRKEGKETKKWTEWNQFLSLFTKFHPIRSKRVTTCDPQSLYYMNLMSLRLHYPWASTAVAMERKTKHITMVTEFIQNWPKQAAAFRLVETGLDGFKTSLDWFRKF